MWTELSRVPEIGWAAYRKGAYYLAVKVRNGELTWWFYRRNSDDGQATYCEDFSIKVEDGLTDEWIRIGTDWGDSLIHSIEYGFRAESPSQTADHLTPPDGSD